MKNIAVEGKWGELAHGGGVMSESEVSIWGSSVVVEPVVEEGVNEWSGRLVDRMPVCCVVGGLEEWSEEESSWSLPLCVRDKLYFSEHAYELASHVNSDKAFSIRRVIVWRNIGVSYIHYRTRVVSKPNPPQHLNFSNSPTSISYCSRKCRNIQSKLRLIGRRYCSFAAANPYLVLAQVICDEAFAIKS